MKYNLLIPLITTCISYYFTINIILKEDKLIIESFNTLFYTVSNDELSLMTLAINLLFYSIMILKIFNTNNHSLKSKFEFVEFAITTTFLIFMPYAFLLFFSKDKLHQYYTDIMFLIYTSLLIFGFLFLTSFFIILLKNKIFYKKDFFM